MQPKGHVSLVRPEKPVVTPRALELNEIPEVIEQFRKGAENAKRAGFDGVEIHGANGYLLDQFLQDKTNKRTDVYGGSVENRARFMLEVTDAVLSIWSAGRVGMHLAPRGDAHDMGDSNPLETFGYVATALGKRKLAFLCARESLGNNRIGPALKKAFGGVYIANEKFTQDTAEQVLKSGEADAVCLRQVVPRQSRSAAAFCRRRRTERATDSSTFYQGGREKITPTIRSFPSEARAAVRNLLRRLSGTRRK